MKSSSHATKRFSLPVVPERNHLLLMVAFSFLVGSLSIFYLSIGRWMWLIFLMGILIGVIQKRLGLRCGVAIVLCSFSLGALYANTAFQMSMPPEGSYEIQAVVSGEITPRTDNRLSFVLTDIRLDGEAVSGKAYCSLHYDDAPPELFDGAKVRFSGRVYHPDGPAGEPHFDFRLWMRQRELAFGVAAYREIAIENTPETAPVTDVAFRVRCWIEKQYERVMCGNHALVMALLFGQRGGLSDTSYQAFQDLGIAHILSVSGLHVTLLGGLLVRFLRRIHVRKGFRFLLSAVLMIGYCAVTGMSAATVRAAVMLMLYMLASQMNRYPDRLTLLGTSMLVVLLVNPLYAHSAGFVLSFCAMLGILLYANPLKKKMRFLPHSLRSLVAVTLTAQLGVLLPTAAYFHHLPLYSLLTNLLIVPLVGSVLIPLYVVLLPVSLVPLAGQLLGALASFLTEGFLWLVQFLSRLPYASVRVASPSAVLCLGLGLAMVILSPRIPGRFRQRAIAAALCAMVAFGGAYAQRPDELRYIQLAAGQADSALLMDGPHTILIDTGVDGEEAMDYLLKENRDIDALILTHLHIDHAGGVTALLENGIRINHVYLPAGAEEQLLDPALSELPDKLKAMGIPVTELASGDELRYNKAGIRVLWPKREALRVHQNANLYPLVLSIELDGYTLLQTSDLLGSHECYAAAPADVLKVAHHGSSTSTGDDFLHIVSPAYALISASSGSRILPGGDTLNRLKNHGVTVLRTDECGDITLSVEDGNLLIKPYKARRAS